MNEEITICECIARMISHNFGTTLPAVKINTVSMHKPGRGPKTGLQLTSPGWKIAPVFYPEDFMPDGRDPEDLNVVDEADRDILFKVVDDMTHEFIKAMEDCENIDAADLIDGVKRGNLIACVTSAARSADMLQNMPHRIFLDLAVYARVILLQDDDAGKQMSMAVNYAAMNKLGMTEDEVIDSALENSRTQVGSRIKRMSEMIPESQAGDIEMTVLTNNKAMYGASVILDNEVLQAVAEIYGGDYYMLPSSVHELIAIPADEDNLPGYRAMVSDINTNVVGDEATLSGNVYRWDSRANAVRIA